MKIDLVRDILDQELVDRNGTNMGRVDGIVLAIDGDEPPRIDHFELGFVVLARRLHPRVEKWVEAIRGRWSVRKEARQIVPWASVAEITLNHVKIDVDASETSAFAWEQWLRDHVVKKIPGSGAEE